MSMRAAAVDLLEKHRFPELADALRSRIDLIVPEWEAAVREALPSANKLNLDQLRNGLPVVLRKLADVLASASAEEAEQLLEQPCEHGVLRFDQDFRIEEMIVEYRLLRRIVIRAIGSALGRAPTLEEDLVLDMGVDSLLQESVVAFVDHQKRQIQAATAGEAKFLSFISHDLRNNLNGVTLTLALLRKRLEGLPEFEEDVADLDATRQSILETINAMERLLQSERLRRKPQIKAAPVDLRALGMEVLRRSATEASKKGLTLTADIPLDAVLSTDREWLTLALQNLVGNAVKFSKAGVITLSAEPREDGGWRIAVADQGPGISPEDQQRLFNAFERGQATGQKGVGLGLVIAAQATRLLGGQITVESTPGAGATFRIDLPPAPPTAGAS